MDFTISTYNNLIQTLQKQGYIFQTVEQFIQNPASKVVILRHDVDVYNKSVMRIAEIEYEYKINSTFYFKAKHIKLYKQEIIDIEKMGHEIGYHYNDLVDTKGNYIFAEKKFNENLIQLRKLVSVSTITFHGAPMSSIDNKDLWKHYNYKDYDIIGEPYFDIDFSKVLYLTDTGRRWDGDKVSVRDRVEQAELQKQYSFHSTQEIIEKAQRHKGTEEDGLPDQIMITMHPQRWTDKPLPWLKELFFQNVKNVVKRIRLKCKIEDNI